MDTPLLESVSRGDADTVKVLIDGGANIEASPSCRKSQTPLLLAAAPRQEACVRELVSSRASLNARDHEGQLPLMLCAGWVPDSRALRVCEYLVERGADASTRGADGRLAAYACALEAGNAQTGAWLQERARVAQELAESELLDDEDKSGRKGIKGGKSGGGKSKGKRAA